MPSECGASIPSATSAGTSSARDCSSHDGRAIYFLYDPDRKLSIDDEFVFSTLDDGAEERVIYAARTFCGERFLQRYNVEFRRIPSGIIRY